jgi:predicted outer membrane repeat protein
VDNVTISSNTAQGGAGLRIDGGVTNILTNLTIRYNTADPYNGGGVSLEGGTTSLSNSVISNNTAAGNNGNGGGIYVHVGNVTITGITVDSNKAKNRGGGIYLADNSGSSSTTYPCTITNSTLSNNSTTSDQEKTGGGGIFDNSYNKTGSTILKELVIISNTSKREGGGMALYARAEVTNVRIQGNQAPYGGGMYIYSGITSSNITYPASTLTNVLITGNYSSTEGGGIRFKAGTTGNIITNATIAANYGTATAGSGIHGGTTSTTFTLRNSIVYGNKSTSGTTNVGSISATYNYCLVEGYSGSTSTTGVISTSNPQFVSLGTASTTPTTAGNYRLNSSSSPAINKGYNSYNSIPTDLDGRQRKIGTIDLGAYECPVISPTSNIVYVKAGGSGSMNGSSWSNAYPNLADPLMLAKTNTNIRTIYVATGTYYPLHAANFNNTTPSTNPRDRAFVLVEGVKIYGGYSTDGSSRNPTGYLTTLSGDIGVANNTDDNVCHVVLGAGTLTAANTVLDGFTITGAYSPSASSYITVNSVSDIYRYYGGGISLWWRVAGFIESYCQRQ